MLIVATRRIILIDKENPIQELTQLCLETIAGWEVLTAASLNEAIVKTETENFDAILLDFEAINSDNYWIQGFERLRNHPQIQQVPIILLTTSEHYQQMPQLQTLKVKATITKPFNLLTLASQIAAVLGWK